VHPLNSYGQSVSPNAHAPAGGVEERRGPPLHMMTRPLKVNSAPAREASAAAPRALAVARFVRGALPGRLSPRRGSV